MSHHRNGEATTGRISGVAATQLRLGGPGFAVEIVPAEDGDGITLGVQGKAAPEQVLRLCGRHGVLVGSADRVDVRLDTTRGHDRYVFTGDMRHRLLFSRVWDRDGHAGVMYGLNPIVGDTEGDPDQVPSRKTLANAVGTLSHGGRLARIDVLNVFTYRTAAAAGLPKQLDSRVADPALERDVLRAADVVLLAWGADGAAHPAAIRQLADLLEELDTRPKVPSKAGRLLVSGTPPQPMHPRVTGYRQVRLVDAPDGWAAGLPADGPTGVEVRTASAEDLERFGVAPEQSTPQAERDGQAEQPAAASRESQEPSTHEAAAPAQAESGADAAGWPDRQPRPLLRELTAAGLGDDRAREVGEVIQRWDTRPELADTVAALKQLLRGEVPILLDGGETEASLQQVLPRLLRATRDPLEIVQSLAVGAICSGAVGEYAAFLECTGPHTNARHKDRPPKWPVPGLATPKDVRLAYARLTGYTGPDDSRGTQARGDARTMRSASYPQPAERYGWADR